MASQNAIRWSVFTKPWRSESTSELAYVVKRMGFDGIELPVRPGYQVEPDDVISGLGSLTKTLADRELQVFSVASTPTTEVMQACGEYGVPMVRIMVPVAAEGFAATECVIRRQLDELLPLCARYGVKIGVQPHYDYYVADSIELARLLSDYDERYIVGIWDAAHDALARKAPAHGLDALWSRLAMVNLKTAYYRRVNTESSDQAVWEPYFVAAKEGMADWQAALRYVIQRGYSGVICLTAEYTDETNLDKKVSADLKYARTLVKENGQS